METDTKKYSRSLVKRGTEADPESSTDPEKLPAVLGMGFLFDSVVFLQTPKGDPAWQAVTVLHPHNV